MKRWPKIFGLVVVLIAILIVIVIVSSPSRLVDDDGEIPVAAVTFGELNMRIHATGELRARHSTMLSAPAIGGGVLQITRLLRTGSPVKKDQVVLEFDPSEQRFTVEQNQSELLQAEQEITKTKADAAVQAAQDKVALLKARFDVRRAQLEVGKNELVSTIDAKKNDLALEQANRVLAQLEQDIKSHAASGRATTALALEKRNKARLEMTEARQNIDKMRVHSPIDGVLAIEKNVAANGGMFWGGISLPDYREGDQVQPGSNIARVIDPSDMEVVAKINERERGSIRVGQNTEVQFDALPGQVFRGTVKSIAGMALKNFWEDDSGGNFEVTIRLPNSDPRLRVGLTTQILILGDDRNRVATLPRQAVFLKDSRPVVYVKKGTSFDVQEVRILAESESRAAIEGLKPGLEVALLDPTGTKKSPDKLATGPSLGGAH